MSIKTFILAIMPDHRDESTRFFKFLLFFFILFLRPSDLAAFWGMANPRRFAPDGAEKGFEGCVNLTENKMRDMEINQPPLFSDKPEALGFLKSHQYPRVSWRQRRGRDKGKIIVAEMIAGKVRTHQLDAGRCDQEEWPECSGDPAACPENSGYGCGGGRAGDKPALSLVESDESAESCECASWCQAGGKFIAAHHRNCRHYDLEGDAQRVIKDLLRGIEASAQDTDGIHPALGEGS